MDIKIGYDAALALFSHALRRKVEYSVALLRKAERLALAYDKENGYYLAFSGGKDSQALYHVAQLAGVRFKAHMSLTSVDPPEVIRFVRRQYPDVEMRKPKMSIYQDAIVRKILPTMRVRWCCADFKEDAGAGKVTLIGIRHEESSRRARRKEVEVSSRKFSGTLSELDEYREKKKAKGVNITNATEERTVGCISDKESLLISPIIHWTEHEVWEFLNALEIPHCVLYDRGNTRIGCLCCPMAKYKQKLKDIEEYPHVKRNWIKAIKAIRGGGGYSKENIFREGYIWWNLRADEFPGAAFGRQSYSSLLHRRTDNADVRQTIAPPQHRGASDTVTGRTSLRVNRGHWTLAAPLGFQIAPRLTA